MTKDTMHVEIETPEGSQLVSIDLNEDLGELTPDEFKLFSKYVVKADVGDRQRATAGAAILVLLSRKVDVDHDSLLEAVI